MRMWGGPLDLRMPASYPQISQCPQNKSLDELSGHMTNRLVEGQDPFCKVRSPAMHKALIRQLWPSEHPLVTDQKNKVSAMVEKFS